MNLTQQIVRELISYDPATGICRWKHRDVKWFKSERFYKSWNSRFYDRIISGLDITTGYIKTEIFNKRYKLHRLIWLYMTGEWPNQVDHINGIRHDNRWVNLRNVTKSDNNKNRSLRIDNKSGFVGIRKSKNGNKWIATIWINNKEKYLGSFCCIFKALKVRKKQKKNLVFMKITEGRRFNEV